MAEAAKSLLANLPTIGNVDLSDVNPVFASRMQSLIAAAEEATGGTVSATSGYRSPQHQAQIYANYTQKPVTYGGQTYQPNGISGIAARPGASQHQLGLAMDINPSGAAYKWMVAHAPEYGVESGTAWSGSQYDPPHFQLPRADNKIALSGLVPPMNIPSVASAYSAGDAAPTPAQMSPAMAAIQQITNPDGTTDWNDFYKGIASPSQPPPSAQSNAGTPLSGNQAAVNSFYSGILPPNPSQITDQASANNFYQGMGLAPNPDSTASTTPTFVPSMTQSAANDFYSSLGIPPASGAAAPALSEVQRNAMLAVPSLVPQASYNSNALGSILSADFGALGSAPTPSLGGAYGSSGLNQDQRNAMLAVPAQSSPSALYYDPGTGQGDTQLPAGVTPNIPSTSPSASRGSGYADWAAPYLSSPTPAYQSSSQNYTEPQNSGASSYAMNSTLPYSQSSPGADLSSLNLPPSVTAPKYINVSQQVAIPQSQPLSPLDSGLSYTDENGIPTPTLGDYGSSEASVPSAGPEYKTIQVQKLNPAYTQQQAALAAYSAGDPYTTPPLGFSTLPATDSDALSTKIGNAIGGTPLGHILSFVQGQQPTAGGGLLGMLTGVLGGGGSNTPVADSLNAALSPAAQLAANPSLAANQNPSFLNAVRNGQMNYSPGNDGGSAPITDIYGNLRQNTSSDATLGIGSNQSLTGV